MKKLLSLCLCLILVGCGTNVSNYENEIKELKLEIQTLENTNKTLENRIKDIHLKLTEADKKLNEIEELEIKISGVFGATLVQLLPDYGIDDRVIGVAVLHWFQGNTFVVRIDSEVAKELKVGKMYIFEVEEQIIKGHTLNEVKELIYTVQGYTKIIGYREPKDSELGLGSPQITLEKVK